MIIHVQINFLLCLCRGSRQELTELTLQFEFHLLIWVNRALERWNVVEPIATKAGTLYGRGLYFSPVLSMCQTSLKAKIGSLWLLLLLTASLLWVIITIIIIIIINRLLILVGRLEFPADSFQLLLFKEVNKNESFASLPYHFQTLTRVRFAHICIC